MSTATSRPDGPSEADEFHVAISGDQFKDLELALSPERGPNADEPERGAFCVITRARGRDRVTYLVHDVIMPHEEDTYWAGSGPMHESGDTHASAESETHGLQYRPEYQRRARRAAESVEGGGLLIVHTHPGGAASPNKFDRRRQRRNLYPLAQRLDPDAPLAAMLYSEGAADENRQWHVRAVGMNVARTRGQQGRDDFGPDTGPATPATAIRVVGQEFDKKATVATNPGSGPRGTTGEIDEALVDSVEELWGFEGQRELAGLRVGVTGCGGGGSILAEYLSRLGVGEVVLVDFDHIEPANFNRHQGARRVDVEEQRLKVRVSARIAANAATAENFQVRPVVGSVVESYREEYDPLPHLLDCDIIINAADPHWVRKVLDDFAYASLIPVLDGGNSLDIDDDGELTSQAYASASLAGPSHACLECADAWVESQVSEDYENPESRGYLGEEEEDRAPSVVSMNGLMENFVLQRFQAFTLGVAPRLTKGAFRYKPAFGRIDRMKYGREELIGCKESCERSDLEGRGEAAIDDIYRFVDPVLTEHIEDHGLEASGVVEPAPEGPEREADTETEAGKEKTVVQKIHSWLATLKARL